MNDAAPAMRKGRGITQCKINTDGHVVENINGHIHRRLNNDELDENGWLDLRN